MDKTIRHLAAAGAAVAALGTGIAVAASSPASATPNPSASTAFIPRCDLSQLHVQLDQRSGGAGAMHDNFALIFRNASHATCHLSGYPRVLAIGDYGRPLGVPAGRKDTAPAHPVALRPNGTAHVEVSFVNVVGAMMNCAPSRSAYLKVTPPSLAGSRYLPFKANVCSKKDTDMWVSPVQPGS